MHNLDKPIIDLIEQHHGTSLIQAFYQKALDEVKETKEESFRYPGPRPKTKEAAILMLTDSCEAAARTLGESSPAKIKDTVEKIIDDKFRDGQLDDAPLSLKDMHKIAESIITTLTGIHHARVEYEQREEKE
ncbi:MAG: phosphohydrolase, partial [Elusimicrobiota bacterium]|nr:phosphohydrolase [Elusimicrobiota bacterium]